MSRKNNTENTISNWREVEIEGDESEKCSGSKINPKMFLTKEELGIWDDRVPSYYRGSNGYEARKVIDNFDLSYHVGTATTYLLRCGKKKEEGMTDTEKHIEDLQKAKNHIDFEIERLKE